MTDIQLRETGPGAEFDVTGAELRALRRARHGLSVQELGSVRTNLTRVHISARTGYAGSVILPGGRRVVVHPKAEIAHLPDLLALAYRTLAPPPRAGSAAVASSTPSEWLLLQLAAEVHDLLSRGLRRGYVEKRERLPFVRGRTRPVLNPAQLPFLDCEYADFVADTPENRLLRGTLELLSPAVSNRAVRRMFDDALGYFGHVSPVRPSVIHFDRLHLTRLNQHYEPSLRLARLALEGAGVVDAAGAATAPAYFVLMWKVWENAVASALRDAQVMPLIEKPMWADKYVQLSGHPKVTVGIEPDLVIGPRQRPHLVIDLKWAPVRTPDQRGRRRLKNAHLDQMASYTSALGCDGVLLYPLMEDAVQSTYSFNGRKIHIKTVDLSRPDLAGLIESVQEIKGLIDDAP